MTPPQDERVRGEFTSPASSLTSSSSSSSTPLPQSSSSSPGPAASDMLFAKFPELPPELRHHIWRLALPTQGINFFNVHSIPNDHPGVNRSTSPPLIYLDLRRLSIDDGDETVAQYDPSAWQAREILRRVCREAREVCAVSPSEAVTITLTRPRRGQFVRAADGQLRNRTPVHYHPDQLDEQAEAYQIVEPLEHRTVRVRADDLLCLSIENCSFNLPFEEWSPHGSGGRFIDIPRRHVISRVIRGSDDEDDDDDDDDDDLGWSYDPQLTPLLPAAIPRSRICIEMARASHGALFAAREPLLEMLSCSQGEPTEMSNMLDQIPLIMFDAHEQELGRRHSEELTPGSDVFWDRYGDRYVALPWFSAIFPADYQLVKVWPEANDITKRYLRSATLQSPKRPAGHPI